MLLKIDHKLIRKKIKHKKYFFIIIVFCSFKKAINEMLTSTTIFARISNSTTNKILAITIFTTLQFLSREISSILKIIQSQEPLKIVSRQS